MGTASKPICVLDPDVELDPEVELDDAGALLAAFVVEVELWPLPPQADNARAAVSAARQASRRDGAEGDMARGTVATRT
jgi:hypothetical protein